MTLFHEKMTPLSGKTLISIPNLPEKTLCAAENVGLLH